MKRTEDILAKCIEDIKADKTTLEDCLAEYSARRQELEPLLRIALIIRESPRYKPTNDFRIRTRVRLMDYIHEEQSGKKPWRAVLYSGVRHSWRRAWFKAVMISVTVLVALSASGAGAAYAAKDSLPGEALYPVKTVTEQVRRTLTFGDMARIELELALAGTRLEEVQALTQENADRTGQAIEGYENSISLAIDKVKNNREISTHELEMIAMEALGHIYWIDAIVDSIVMQERETIRQATEAAFTLQLQALRILSEEEPVRATEINIETMQSRLNRTNSAVDRGDIVEAEAAIRHYVQLREFSVEIIQIARAYNHDITVIDTLNEQAASAQLETINKMYGKLPDETMSSLKKAFGQPEQVPGKETTNPTQGKSENNALKEPFSQPEEQGNQPEELGNQPEEPGNQPEGPNTPPEQPGMPPGEPGTPPGEPGAPPGGPGTPPEEAGNQPEEPGNGNGGSGSGKK